MDGPKDGSRYELQKQTIPRVRAEAGHVILRLELVSLRDPLDKPYIDIALPPDYAGTLAFELLEATKKFA
jgi:hypothetical protein